MQFEHLVVLKAFIIRIAKEAPSGEVASIQIVRYAAVDFVPNFVAELSRPVLNRLWIRPFWSRGVCHAYDDVGVFSAADKALTRMDTHLYRSCQSQCRQRCRPATYGLP